MNDAVFFFLFINIRVLVEIVVEAYLFRTVDLAGAIPKFKLSAIMKLNHFGRSIQDTVAYLYAISSHSRCARGFPLLVRCALGLGYARCMWSSMNNLIDPQIVRTLPSM